MNKTLYVRDEDLAMWTESQRLAIANGETLSAVILRLLRGYVDAAKVCACGQAIAGGWSHCPKCGLVVK